MKRRRESEIGTAVALGEEASGERALALNVGGKELYETTEGEKGARPDKGGWRDWKPLNPKDDTFRQDTEEGKSEERGTRT